MERSNLVTTAGRRAKQDSLSQRREGLAESDARGAGVRPRPHLPATRPGPLGAPPRPVTHAPAPSRTGPRPVTPPPRPVTPSPRLPTPVAAADSRLGARGSRSAPPQRGPDAAGLLRPPSAAAARAPSPFAGPPSRGARICSRARGQVSVSERGVSAGEEREDGLGTVSGIVGTAAVTCPEQGEPCLKVKPLPEAGRGGPGKSPSGRMPTET
ncbi:translation initiation factor IF-2 [Dasypus novemcinctus]|uniref:translation initiation factor IF-2 n=1 Tax=Dasypus novemcinctus TaxID=9361 RepID=UPI0039C98FF1